MLLLLWHIINISTVSFRHTYLQLSAFSMFSCCVWLMGESDLLKYFHNNSRKKSVIFWACG